jgi:hypothetical protein
VLHVLRREVGPPGLKLDADSLAVEAACLDDGCPYAAHRVEHHVARIAVGADRSPGELGQHLRRVAV